MLPKGSATNPHLARHPSRWRVFLVSSLVASGEPSRVRQNGVPNLGCVGLALKGGRYSMASRSATHFRNDQRKVATHFRDTYRATMVGRVCMIFSVCLAAVAVLLLVLGAW